MVDATRTMIDELAATYSVESAAGSPEVDFPNFQASATYVALLRPSEGAPLAFMFTDFPGVVVRAGDFCVEAFPACGCDACDESPTDVVQRLEQLVIAVVEGRYVEDLTKRSISYTFTGASGASSSEKRLEGREWKQHGSLGSREWSAWAKR